MVFPIFTCSYFLGFLARVTIVSGRVLTNRPEWLLVECQKEVLNQNAAIGFVR